jgi:hypothetical protein
MDPKQALMDLLTSAQRAGLPYRDKTDFLDDMDDVIESAKNLKEWVEKGGTLPELYIIFREA